MGLAGFSQGGAMSIFSGLQMPEAGMKLGCIQVMSGYLPAKSKFKLTEGLENTPILHCHGTNDPVVMFSWGEQSKEFLKQQYHVNDYSLKAYNGVQHSISSEIIQDSIKFLNEKLPASDEYIVLPPRPESLATKVLLKAIRENGLQKQALGQTEKSELIKLLDSHYKSIYGEKYINRK